MYTIIDVDAAVNLLPFATLHTKGYDSFVIASPALNPIRTTSVVFVNAIVLNGDSKVGVSLCIAEFEVSVVVSVEFAAVDAFAFSFAMPGVHFGL